ncbi:GAF domain-containing sensor histidine kinase [Kineococcus sp. NUM-3379]
MGGSRVDGEAERLAALLSYELLDTPPEHDFDDIATLAAEIAGTPIALVSLVDSERQWFKARVGLDVCETPREASFCARTIEQDGLFVVPDATRDPRFAASPLVTGEPHVRFYAGAPLVSPAGHALGSLCVLDHTPRELTGAQRRALLTLARHVVTHVELRQYHRAVEAANERLLDADRLKEEFLARITHEIRTPMTSIEGYLEMLGDGGLDPHATATAVDAIRRNTARLRALVDDMLLAAQLSTTGVRLHLEPVDVGSLVHAAVAQNAGVAGCRGLTITAEVGALDLVTGDRTRLAQTLDRLVLNAVKFTPSGSITVRAHRESGCVVLEVSDTGIGIPAEEQAAALRPFGRGRQAEAREQQGAGLGLAIVNAVVVAHHGVLGIDSEPGRGTTVRVTLPARPSAQAQEPSPSAARVPLAGAR